MIRRVRNTMPRPRLCQRALEEGGSYGRVAQRFDATREEVCQYATVVTRLPADLGAKVEAERNPLSQRKFSLRALLGVASVITHAGAGTVITEAVKGAIPIAGQTPVLGFAVLAILSAAISVVATTVGCIAIMTPIVNRKIQLDRSDMYH